MKNLGRSWIPPSVTAGGPHVPLDRPIAAVVEHALRQGIQQVVGAAEIGTAEAVSLDGENTHGVILPVGDGSIAIIGAREEKLERVEKSVLNSVMWST